MLTAGIITGHTIAMPSKYKVFKKRKRRKMEMLKNMKDGIESNLTPR